MPPVTLKLIEGFYFQDQKMIRRMADLE